MQQDPNHFSALQKFPPVANRYEELFAILARQIPENLLIRDPLRTFAYGTDASFYRLIPKMVVRVRSEADVIYTMRSCKDLKIPFTFRAAGTSLSGQAISDSVLLQLSRQWNKIEVGKDGQTARCDPAVLGSEANRALTPFGRKIGPDPASIDAAMIGGIAANNSSGMCCGNVQDTYHTLESMRIVFADGFVLDTGAEESRNRFRTERRETCEAIACLTERVRNDFALGERIRHKYRIKNTTGYSINALIDFEDPIDIIAHLLIGSEGTLGFISEITYRTVPDPPFHATSLVFFPDMQSACEASFHLSQTEVAAVELMDWQSIQSVREKPGIPDYFNSMDERAVALLLEVRADSEVSAFAKVAQVKAALGSFEMPFAISFTTNKKEVKQLWDIRKGLFPSLGYAREKGTTILIEDVAFPIEKLAPAANDLRLLLNQYGYFAAVIFGHALQGNLHFVFSVDFNQQTEVQRYAAFLNELTVLVVDKYNGSLKAEHGTGRNMAPFVKREWGAQAFGLMREIKRIFDPDNLLNPGVILSDDPNAHIANLKATPATNPIIEKCTECGFCERTCPSRDLSLTPRHRIAAWREISRLEESGEDSQRLAAFRKSFDYAGEQTCAADGLCATLCPVGIDTGSFVKDLRALEHGHLDKQIAEFVARHFGSVLAASRVLLRATHAMHLILGTKVMAKITNVLRTASGNRVPKWNAFVPNVAAREFRSPARKARETVVYFPACVSRLFGVARNSPYPDSQNVTIAKLLEKAGYGVLYPNDLGNLCCGMAFQSKGYPEQAEQKAYELTEKLLRVSADGELPVLLDTSPCASRMKNYLGAHPALRVYDLNEFLLERVIPRIKLTKLPISVGVHVPCSVRKEGHQDQVVQLAKLCAERVHVPSATPCCGFAGDRGFAVPELPAAALVQLKIDLPSDCQIGFSSSRTCEIGVSLHSGVQYQSIAYLLDAAASAVGEN